MSKQQKWTKMAVQNFRQSYTFRGDKQKIQWFPGHMVKGLRQMRQVLLKTDCVIEVHDARIPFSGRNKNFRHDITGGKPHILVLNKKDLVFDYKNRKSQKYTEEEIRHKILEVEPTLSEVIFSNCKDIRCKGLQSVLPTTIELLSSTDRFHRQFNPDSSALVIGIPNVGKSSLINLIRSGSLRIKGKALKTGNMPGVTRALQTKIRVSDDPLVYLLDTPGIMMPNISNLEAGMKLASCATLKDEQVGLLDIADYILYQLNKNHVFDYVEYMGLEEPHDQIWEMLTISAEAKGQFRMLSKAMTGEDPREVPCIQSASLNFIRAFRSGAIGKLILDADSFR
eukprot:07075.XXX_386913_383306_1 [CDS] Oithona nana genome sequencing.